MVLVMGRRKLDLSKPSEFCGRHKLVLGILVIFIVMLMSASVCAMQVGPSTVTAQAGGTASGSRASTLAGGYPNPPRYSPIVYHERYDFGSFSDADWYMTFRFTNTVATEVASLPVDDQPIALDAFNQWIANFGATHEGFVRWPKYHKLWSRSEIGQPI